MKIISKKNTSTYLLILAIAASLAAAFIGIQTVEKFTNALPVVVAKVEIPAYTPITEEMLTIEKLPKAAIKQGMFGDVKGAIGKVPKTVIPEGFPVSESFLATEGKGSLLTTNISQFNDPTLRAVPVKLDDINAIAGKIVPGDKVDVIGSMKLPIGGIQQPVSQTIGVGVPVLSLMGEANKPTGAVLALTPQQAQDVGFAEQAGQIKLSLNPYQPDKAAAKTSPTTPTSFVQKYIVNNQEQPSQESNPIVVGEQ